MNAIARTTLDRDLIRAWRRFWETEARKYAGPGLLFDIYDDNTVIRDSLGNHLDRIDSATARDEVFARLAQLRLERAQQ